MGFNNEGVDTMVARLKKRKNKTLIIGGNIGKNKITPNEKAIDDTYMWKMKVYDSQVIKEDQCNLCDYKTKLSNTIWQIMIKKRQYVNLFICKNSLSVILKNNIHGHRHQMLLFSVTWLNIKASFC